MYAIHARPSRLIAAAILAAAPTAPARADLILNQVIVDMTPGKPARDDIEASNTGSERLYVVAEPAEIVAPGTDAERRVSNPDPGVSGLLVTPQRMILEPGERKLIRIAAIGPRPDRDRIYRVAIKPVVGDVAAQATALKILIGYDALVIVRPATMMPAITGQRDDRRLILRNAGNSSAEIYAGRQCDAADKACLDLPALRLYAGASHSVSVKTGYTVRYRAKTGDRIDDLVF